MMTASILGNIIRDTQYFLESACAQSQPPARSDNVSNIPSICLPEPPSLYPSLIAVGADVRIAKEMDRVYIARVLELRSYYETSIAKAFRALADFPLPHTSERRLLDTFANLYLTKVKSWIEDIIVAYKSCRKPVPTSKEESGCDNLRQAFNTDYVPLLEHFFDENPFPTHADKVFLAKKSGMTYRQIHVWNRRNRTKRAGKSWRKKPTSEGATLPLDGLRARMGKYVVRDDGVSFGQGETPSSNRSNERKSSQEASTLDARMLRETEGHSNVLDKYLAPPHAFPSPYPPAPPLKTCGQMSLITQWPRRPSNSPDSPLRTTQITLDDLVDRFALLSVRDNYSRSFNNSSAATCSITVIPSPAPHPALLNPTAVTPLPRISLLPIVRASKPPSDIFTMSTPPFIHTARSGTSSSPRKYSPLPKRCPPQNLSHRSVTPAASETSSSTPSPPSSVRSLSGSSDFWKDALFSSSPSLPLSPLLPCSGAPNLLVQRMTIWFDGPCATAQRLALGDARFYADIHDVTTNSRDPTDFPPGWREVVPSHSDIVHYSLNWDGGPRCSKCAFYVICPLQGRQAFMLAVGKMIPSATCND